jgi:hypothetical protein
MSAKPKKSILEQVKINNGRLFDHTQYTIKSHEDNPDYWAKLLFDDIRSTNKHGEKTFGVLGHVASSTRDIIIYNHPAFKKIAKTAFTDGHYIYMDADFLMEMVNSKSKYKTDDGSFVILHELSHMLYQHCDHFIEYMKAFPRTTNEGLDFRINMNLHRDFVATGILKGPGPQMQMGMGYSFGLADKIRENKDYHGDISGMEKSIEKYGTRDEILIVDDLLKNTQENPEDETLDPSEKNFTPQDIKDACQRAGLDKVWDKIKDDLVPDLNDEQSLEDEAGQPSGQADNEQSASNDNDNGQAPEDNNSTNPAQQEGDTAPEAGQDGHNQEGASQDGSQPGQSDNGNGANSPSQQGAGQGSGEPGGASGQGQGGPMDQQSVSVNDLSSALNGQKQGRHLERILGELGVQMEKGQANENGMSGPSMPGNSTDGENGMGVEDKHFISQEDIAKILEENGLENVMDVLDIPKSSDHKGHERKRQERKVITEANVHAANKEMIDQQRRGDSTPGQNSLLEARHIIELEQNSDMEIITVMTEMIDGGGGEHLLQSDRTLNSIFNVNPTSIGLPGNSRIIEPGNVLHRQEGLVLVLVDTSGSVSKPQLIKFLSQIKAIAGDPDADETNTVILMNMDTGIANDFEVINDTNIVEWVENATAYQGGGTNIQNGIIEGLNEVYDNEIIRSHPLVQNRQLTGLIVFSDGEDSVPNIDYIMEEVYSWREDQSLELPATLFAFDKESFLRQGERFRREAGNWSFTLPIDKKVGPIDLNDVKEIQRQNKKNNYEEYSASRNPGM